MQLLDYILLGIIVVAVVFALYKMFRGGGACGSCSGNCASCHGKVKK